MSLALIPDVPAEHFLEDRLFDPATARYVGENILAPYRAVRRRFAALGIPIHTAAHLEEGAQKPDHARGLARTRRVWFLLMVRAPGDSAVGARQASGRLA